VFANTTSDDVAVAGQMSTLFDRSRPQDFVAIYAVLREGRYTRDRLTELLQARGLGYNHFLFAGVLAELPHISDEEFEPYNLDDLEIAMMRARFADWYRSLVESGIPS
jgi:hypothetical protein